MSATRVKQDCRYLGAVPWVDRYVSTASLKANLNLIDDDYDEDNDEYL